MLHCDGQAACVKARLFDKAGGNFIKIRQAVCLGMADVE